MSGTISPKITDGLLFYLDAANTTSYISGSTTTNNLINTNEIGNLINSTDFSTENQGTWVFDGTDYNVHIGEFINK